VRPCVFWLICYLLVDLLTRSAATSRDMVRLQRSHGAVAAVPVNGINRSYAESSQALKTGIGMQTELAAGAERRAREQVARSSCRNPRFCH
jgi:hypothetical protein